MTDGRCCSPQSVQVIIGSNNALDPFVSQRRRRMKTCINSTEYSLVGIVRRLAITSALSRQIRHSWRENLPISMSYSSRASPSCQTRRSTRSRYNCWTDDPGLPRPDKLLLKVTIGGDTVQQEDWQSPRWRFNFSTAENNIRVHKAIIINMISNYRHLPAFICTKLDSFRPYSSHLLGMTNGCCRK